MDGVGAFRPCWLCLSVPWGELLDVKNLDHQHLSKSNSCLLPSCTLREARGRSLKDGCTFSFCVCLLKHLRCLLNQLDVWLLMRYVLLLCSLEVTLALAFSVSSSCAALSACAAG